MGGLNSGDLIPTFADSNQQPRIINSVFDNMLARKQRGPPCDHAPDTPDRDQTLLSMSYISDAS